ncbi:MAG: hypothetical protein JST48_08600 [Bacteroidetes bacterium]|nr:hypothetical protein [Bacteroidota bacterium]
MKKYSKVISGILGIVVICYAAYKIFYKPIMPPIAIIPIERAVVMISDFMDKKENAKLHDLAINAGHGGMFKVDHFRISNKNIGVMLWFCYDSTKTSEEFYVALEQVDKYDSTHFDRLPRFATTNQIIKPYIFLYPKKENTDTPAVRKHVIEDRCLLPQPKPGVAYKFDTLDSATVNKSIKNFKRKMKFISNPIYCEYSFSVFTENNHPASNTKDHILSDFLYKIDGVGGYVKYYFAYEEKDKKGNDLKNKIRLVLVAVDKEGKKIKPKRNGNGDGTTVEDSWPPPPPTTK